jgi:hypothetical protein
MNPIGEGGGLPRLLSMYTSSLVGIHDRLAKTILDIIVRLSEFLTCIGCECLEDMCAIYQKGVVLLNKL